MIFLKKKFFVLVYRKKKKKMSKIVVKGGTTIDPAMSAAVDEMLRKALLPLASASDAQMKKLFEMIDADGSKTIDIAEFGLFFKSLGCENLSPDCLSYLLHKLDTDGNGTIEFSEFLKVSKGFYQDFSKINKVHVNKGPPIDAEVSATADEMLKLALSPMSAASDAQMQKMFQIIDADGSKTVDVFEFGLFFKSMGCNNLSPACLGYLMNKVDTDGNGTIEFGEFLKVIKSYI